MFQLKYIKVKGSPDKNNLRFVVAEFLKVKAVLLRYLAAEMCSTRHFRL